MRNVIVLIALVLGLMLLPSAAAFADAGTHASCIGLEASGISAPGTSDEFPGGMPQLVTFLHETFPHQQGAIVGSVAKIHAGSHEACDEATE
jgi:hypothetical protein